eukprot:scaffold1169_cov120-Cylindrotheca_fusiformis.AAC.27
MSDQVNTLQFFISSLLEEKSMTSISIEEDNAKTLLTSSSQLSLSCSESCEPCDPCELDVANEPQHSSFDSGAGQSLNQLSPIWYSKKVKESTSRWDSLPTQKSLETPKRMLSPKCIRRMLKPMDFPYTDVGRKSSQNEWRKYPEGDCLVLRN